VMQIRGFLFLLAAPVLGACYVPIFEEIHNRPNRVAGRIGRRRLVASLPGLSEYLRSFACASGSVWLFSIFSNGGRPEPDDAPSAIIEPSPANVITLLTKILTSCAVLVGLTVVAPIAVAKAIPYVFEKFASDSTIFVSVHFHALPFIARLILWMVIVICARISFLNDKRRSLQK
jgi:hypothetical protein